MSKKVLVTGLLGQDGANMAEYLLKNTDNLVYGMVRRSATPNYVNIKGIQDNPKLKIVYGDLSDEVSINELVKTIQPDYLINFAANSFVGCSWDMPMQVFDVNSLGVLRCLEAIRKFKPDCRFYSAGSSEEYGNVDYSPQDIKHPVKPRSPYAASKAAARFIVKVYRESYNLYAVHGILFNHEGLRRSEEFVTRKITKGIARIIKSIERGEKFEPVRLGNLDAKRDWSDSEDFMDGVWRIMNQELYMDNKYGEDLPKFIKEYILSSNETHSIREFCDKALKVANIDGYWEGKGENEKFLIANHVLESCNIKNGVVIEVSKEFFRPNEVSVLHGNSDPVRKELGWNPKISFDKLVERMVLYDLNESSSTNNLSVPNPQIHSGRT